MNPNGGLNQIGETRKKESKKKKQFRKRVKKLLNLINAEKDSQKYFVTEEAIFVTHDQLEMELEIFFDDIEEIGISPNGYYYKDIREKIILFDK